MRDMLIARYFGTGPYLDGFFVAFRIPNLFRRLVAEGSLTISFVPVYTEYLQLYGQKKALELAQKVFTLLLLLLIIINTLGVIFSPQLVSLFGYGFTDSEVIEQTIALGRIMFPYLFFISIVAFCMGFLNSNKHFFAPSFSPVLLNVGFIFGAVVLRHYFEFQLTGLAIGVVIGGLLQLLLQIPFMIKKGFILHFSIDTKHTGVIKIAKMASAAIVGGAVYQINLLINTILASMLAGGSISYLYFSDRLTEMVMGIFIVSIGSVMLPELSKLASQNKIAELKTAFSNTLKAALFFAVPASVGLAVTGREILTVLFMRGKFDSTSVDNTYTALIFASFGIIFLALYKMLTQIYYSMKNTRTPVLTAAIALITNAILGYFLMQTELKHGGLALANASAMGLQVVLLFIFLYKAIGNLKLKRIVLPVVKIVFSAGIMGIVLFYLKGILEFDDGVLILKTLNLFVLIVVGGSVYLMVSVLSGVYNFKQLIGMYKKNK
jgi:putative peptidoglycan lipid II flippase